MVNSGLKAMVQVNKQKFFQAFIVLENSITHIETFNFNKKYSLTELIPFDAMCDRFIRTVEVASNGLKPMRNIISLTKAKISETYYM